MTRPRPTSDAWIAAAKATQTGGKYGIAFNQTESFWLVPFLGGYGGSVSRRTASRRPSTPMP